MKATNKRWLLMGLTLAAIGAVFLFPPFAQAVSYHEFSDKRALLGIPNFANVISNIPFLFVGTSGLLLMQHTKIPPGLSVTYVTLFAGIVITGVGSGYYHYAPDNNTLVYDRIPLTLVFMSLLSATVSELIDRKTGIGLLIPLLLIGVVSVWWWHYGEVRNQGDLRLYGLVQFYPMIFIPLILLLFYDPAQKPTLRPLASVVVWYGIAKVCELLDKPIYGGIGISGHTLKHLAAAVSTWYLVKMFHQKYSTISDWVSNTCKLITPLYDALQKEVLASNYLHADETPIKVLDKDKKGETHRGYFWVYHNSLQDMLLFDYQPGRGREGPSEILKNFQGHLQTDGYAAYNIFKEQKDVTLLHCMAHARRKFIEAEPNDTARSRLALEQIQQLYAIERKATDEQLNELDVLKLRQQQSVPILESLGKWMQQAYVEVLPKSAIGKALAYSIERWQQLMIYTTDGKLNIDNNPVERAIRPVAVGRKNYLFAGSHEAAQRSAMLYSLLGTCKLRSINPYGWLKSVLETIPSHPINKIQELLP